MQDFQYCDGQLYCEDVPLQRIAEQIGTPTYVYSAASLTRQYKRLEAAMRPLDHLIAYAVKANGNIAVLRLLAKLGAGADIVSGGELSRAIRAGIDPEHIVFSGVGKSHADIRAALEAGIGLFNIESWPEALRISDMAQSCDRIARVGFRVNPRIAAGGHDHISTGRAEDKFGIALEETSQFYREARSLPGLEVCGIATHIGSQIEDIAPMREAFAQLLELVARLRADGHTITHIDIGGGLAIPYTPQETPDTPEAYGDMISQLLGKSEVKTKIILEPGRIIVGNAGVLLSQIEYIRHRDNQNFVILDAGMNDLMRPALYQAHHEIWPLSEPDASAPLGACNIVGPVCESADQFALQRPMPPLKMGDRLAILSAGAYGASMASQYNTRSLVPEIMVSQDRFALIRERPDFERMIAGEHCPDWL